VIETITLLVCVFAIPASAQWLHCKSPGVPRLADGRPDLDAPAPRSRDGKPDLSGVWRVELSAQASPTLRPWAEALAKSRMEDLRRDSPEARCLPGPIATMGVGKIVHTPSLLLMLYGGTSYREIFLDGRELPTDPNPDWLGYSVGRWEGDTLIVETVGFNDRTWLRGTGVPGSEQLHVTERIHRDDFGHLDIQATYVDVCSENERDRAHMIGKASELSRQVFIPGMRLPMEGASS